MQALHRFDAMAPPDTEGVEASGQMLVALDATQLGIGLDAERLASVALDDEDRPSLVAYG
ncbi:hypothetical protein [Candidatus Chloroploca sp. Khr17]|uniref:hypothetical protein n=1 Tax=Candidatus Chloroploca sp. Khr17 TaxID=2496869 RepID=UPI00101C51D3|nr:hypothetical protein [Candidatus Chloroploca sp. Khr17]